MVTAACGLPRRLSRQDLRMLPANSTGTPADQALAGGVVQGSAAEPAPAPALGSSPDASYAMQALNSSTSGARVPDGRRVGAVQQASATSKVPSSDLSAEDSNIVFPTPAFKPDLPVGPPKFDPLARSPSRFGPSCAKGSTFCTDVNDYPENYVQHVLRSAASGFREYIGKDVISESNNITQRIDANDENPLCPYEETVVYPKVAKNKEDKWLYVVNQDHFVQGVRIETCLNQGTPCSLAENFPLGYTTSCRQKYILRKLVALNPEGQTQTDMFRLPSCCSCYVSRSNISSRIRSGMTPAIKKPGSRKR